MYQTIPASVSGQRRRLLADEENAVRYIMPVGIHCGEGDEEVEREEGTKGRWHTHCLSQTFFEYTSEWMRSRDTGVFFYINDAIHIILFRTKNTGIATQLFN